MGGEVKSDTYFMQAGIYAKGWALMEWVFGLTRCCIYMGYNFFFFFFFFFKRLEAEFVNTNIRTGYPILCM